MNEPLFTRETSEGTLACRLGRDCLGDIVAEFYLNNIEIREKTSAGVSTVEYLTLPRNQRFYADEVAQLKQLGATAVWDFQVALYGNEPQIIEAAVKQAEKDAEEAALKQLNETDIVVTEKLYNGTPQFAENANYRWHWMSGGRLFCKKTGDEIYQMKITGKKMTEDQKKEASKFLSDIRLIQRYAEIEYERKQAQKEKEEFYKNNPRLEGLSLAEIKAKAEQWDAINNEGGEGYNPYR